MNIVQAKTQIGNAMTAYFSKDEFGEYQIPPEKQRPIFMIGPPGVGKTAIMEQVASELNVGLVSYSMTHHTRQSALGLPYITQKSFEGYDYQVSEYTMSEIIGAVYDLMRETGIREGILFLDEINCVSETLAPCMLQFLQYKVFGQHRLPKGWIVVTAGNPPEYNKSVRDFDIVTWDRLKRIDVEPDYDVWKLYAAKRNVHPAVTTYLSARRKDFYHVESTVDGHAFVTARSWDDLSEMIKLYEKNSIAVDGLLIRQYLQDSKVAKEFTIYYDLFNKYRSDYQMDAILSGSVTEDIVFRAKQAKLDERLSLLGLLYEGVTAGPRQVCQTEEMLELLMSELRKVRDEVGSKSVAALLEEHANALDQQLTMGRRASSLSVAKQKIDKQVIALLDECRREVLRTNGNDFAVATARYEQEVDQLRRAAEQAGRVMSNAFSFVQRAFDQGDEMLLFVTELTVNYFTARFIGHYGCDQYDLYNKALAFEERRQDLKRRADAIHWEL